MMTIPLFGLHDGKGANAHGIELRSGEEASAQAVVGASKVAERVTLPGWRGV